MKKTLLKSAAITASVFALGLAAVACGATDDQDKKPEGKDEVYAVTYSLNGGTGALPTETAKKEGAKFTLAASTGLTNGDKLFDGWHDGTAKYDAGAEYTMPGHAVTFTAQWKDDSAPIVKYHVTYDLNGGTGTAPTESDKAKDEKFKLAAATGLTNGKLVFDGWFDGAKKYDAGAEYTMPEKDVKFTAQWKEDALYIAYELDYKGTILLYKDGKGLLDYYSESADKNIEVNFTYTLDGSAIAITIGGSTFNGTYDGKLLTIDITYASNVFKFGQAAEQPVTGAPTFTFQLNGGTGTVPTLTATEEMLNTSSGTYMVPMPANTITPPAGKAFRRWVVSDGKDEWTVNAGSKFSADKGAKYTVKPEWKDAAPEAPTGTIYNGNWNTPAGVGGVSAVPSVNVKKVWLDLDKNVLFYNANDAVNATKVTIEAEDDALTAVIIAAYGNDASLYSVKIETLGYHLIVTADKSKLAFAELNADMTIIDGSEFTKDTAPTTYTVTYNKPDGAVGADMAVVTAQEGEYTLAACTYTKEGWTFFGWLDESLDFYDDPVLVAAGEKITLSGDVSYVAVFAKTYTNANDSAVTVSLRDDEYVLWNKDGDLVYANWAPVSENLIMIAYGWAYTAYINLIGNTYTECDEMVAYSFTTKDGNTTLTFDGNGKAILGTHEGTYEKMMESQGWYGDVLVGVKLTFGGNTYECEFEYDEDYVPYINVTITVGGVDYVFDPFTAWYTITFEVDDDVQGAPESPVQIHTSIGGDTQAKVEFPDDYYMSKDGYYFVGWAVKNSDGSVGDTITNTYNYKVTQDTTFVAVWVKSTFTITYIPGDVGDDAVTGFEEGGTASVNPYTLEGNIAKLRTDVTRAGYLLSHWVIQGDDSGTTYAPGQANVKVTGDTTFVAVWGVATTYTVTYEKGDDVVGDVPESNSVSAIEGGKVTVTLNNGAGLSVAGKVFAGWKIKNSDNTLSETVYKGTAEISGNTTFVAYFAESGNKLYDYGGEGSANKVIYGYSSSSDAGDNVIKASNKSGSEKTFFKAEVYYNSSTAASNQNRFFVYIYYSSMASISITQIDGEYISDPSLANQAVTVTNASFVQSDGSTKLPFVVTFSIVNGKRTMTLTVGDQTVTWEEIA